MTTEKEETIDTAEVAEPKKATKSKKSGPDFKQTVAEGQESLLRNWAIELPHTNEDGSMEWKSYTARALNEKEVLRLANHDGYTPYRLTAV